MDPDYSLPLKLSGEDLPWVHYVVHLGHEHTSFVRYIKMMDTQATFKFPGLRRSQAVQVYAGQRYGLMIRDLYG